MAAKCLDTCDQTGPRHKGPVRVWCGCKNKIYLQQQNTVIKFMVGRVHLLFHDWAKKILSEDEILLQAASSNIFLTDNVEDAVNLADC